MEMDLTITRYADFAALDLYCYRVAGVVGLMMTHVFGFVDRSCLTYAVALGKAMQLTNILRDVSEDFDRGRVYLPQDELARFGISEEQLRLRFADDRFRSFVQFQIRRAREYYAAAEPGVPMLVCGAAQLTVRVMGRLYGAILEAIEGLDYDVFRARAFVPLSRKMALLAECQGQTIKDRWSRFWR
ncbi:MAG: hypothetical protein NVSMB14_01090 [Isosphaeraceae bacterium]